MQTVTSLLPACFTWAGLWLQGTGAIRINRMPMDVYFGLVLSRYWLLEPFQVLMLQLSSQFVSLALHICQEQLGSCLQKLGSSGLEDAPALA